jgi:hypothetical protein
MKKLNVFFPVPRIYGPSLHETKNKLFEYGKDFAKEADDWIDADVIVLQLIGDPDRKNLVHPSEVVFSDLIKVIMDNMNHIPTIVFPLCNINNTSNWRYLFENASMIYSYLDVDYQIKHVDGQLLPFVFNKSVVVREPLGVEPGDFFREDDMQKQYLIYTFGFDKETESIDIIFDATVLFNSTRENLGLPILKMLHSGRDFGFDSKYYQFETPAPQNQKGIVRARYNSSYFANALRADAWVEGGFEMANIEAPLCGCQPITYNFECYQHWFKGISEFVNVPLNTDPRSLSNRKHVVEQLVNIFNRGTNGRDKIYKYTVSVNDSDDEDEKTKEIGSKLDLFDDKRNMIYERFLWENVASTFWKEVLNKCAK